MYRRLVVLIVLFVHTAALGAQDRAPVAMRQARLSITPLVGLRTPLLTARTTPVIVAGSLIPAAVSLQPQRGAGATAGAEVDLYLGGRAGVTGAFLYTNPDPIVLTTQPVQNIVSQLRINGPSVWFARAGVSYRLPEAEWIEGTVLPAGYLMVGPALVRQDFTGSALRLGGEDDTLDSWAVHLGYRALFPIGSPNFAIQVTLEDYVPFWNRAGEEERLERILTFEPGTVVSADFGYDRPHILMLNVGLALRF